MSTPPTKQSWLMLAVLSGACAAFNGVFAKLTTTELTSSFATFIAPILGLDSSSKPVEYVIRVLFFGLNLLFNAIMWGLFTRALTLSSSTVRVSIINTSANFMVTAMLSFIVFSEDLPAQWWLGASLLVAGSVIIGMREETDKKDVTDTMDDARLSKEGGAEHQQNEKPRDDGKKHARSEPRSVRLRRKETQ